MKLILAALVAGVLLGASVAHAKPPTKLKPASSKPTSAKDAFAFACTITELRQWEMPDGQVGLDIVIAVRLSCHNNGTKTVRLKTSDVFLVNTDDQKYRADRDSDLLDTIYEDENPGPEFVDRFIDIAKGETKDIGFAFVGGVGLTDPRLTLDIDGTKYVHHRAPTFTAE